MQKVEFVSCYGVYFDAKMLQQKSEIIHAGNVLEVALLPFC